LARPNFLNTLLFNEHDYDFDGLINSLSSTEFRGLIPIRIRLTSSNFVFSYKAQIFIWIDLCVHGDCDKHTLIPTTISTRRVLWTFDLWSLILIARSFVNSFGSSSPACPSSLSAKKKKILQVWSSIIAQIYQLSFGD
jgi:hypothetical protein